MKVFGEERINTYFSNSQSAPAVAALTGGGYVVTWVSDAQDGNGDGIYAQRLDANGVGIGPEFRVNTTKNNTQTDPSIAGLSDGSFLVVWTDYAADGNSYGVFAQRYNAGGVPQGGEFQINTYTNSVQYQPSVAAYGGGYVVTWASYSQDGSVYGVYSQRYDNAGSKVGVETLVNTTTTNNQDESDVAAYANGSYVVVWRSDSGLDINGTGVYAQRFDNAGTKVGSETLVNTTTTSNQYEPRVTTLAGGGFVVVWTSDNQDGSSAGVYAQRFDAGGSKLGGEFRVNESTVGGQSQPDVIGLPAGGFVVSWYNDNRDVGGAGSSYDVYVREYDSVGTALTGQIKGNTPTPVDTTQFQPVLASLGNGDYTLVWTSGNDQDGSNNGIYQQLFGNAAHFTRQANPTLEDFGGTLNLGENAANAAPQALDFAVSLADSDSPNFDTGRVTVFFTSGATAQDQLTVISQGQIGLSGSAVSYGGTQIGTLSGGVNGANLVITFNANATVDAVEELIQHLGYLNSSGSPNPTRTLSIRVEDGDGGSTIGGIVTINVARETDGTAAAYGEEQVNTYTTNHQQWPSVAGLSGGGYVVTWISSGQDGDTWGVYAQRYAGNGEAVGAEVRVNTLTAGEQNWPQIAGLSNGGYVITWQDDRNDGSGWGVYGQRYDAGGVAQGSQFLLNTFTSSNQFHDNVVAYNGGFAAVWSSINNAGGSSYDVYLQRFANDGSPVGTELRVSNVPGGAAAQTGNQYVPDVAAFANGNLVIVWSDEGGNDGSSYGVFGKIVDANNQPVGSTFLVNTTTIGNQTYSANGDYGPNVATLAGGGFVVVWPSDSNDDSGWAVVAQRFDASGNKVGSEFVVNESTTGSQYIPDVTALSTGGFVVTWYNDNYDVGGTGTTADVYIREYDAAGVAVDGQRKVSINTPSTDFEPSVADLGQGNFAVVWSGYNHESASPNTYDIFQQLYGSGAALARPSVSPQLADFTGTVTFAENTVNAGLQVIDAAVGLSDPDSGNFNGGRLDLYFIQNGAAEDRLGVVHQGTGPGQIGVSGTTVSYGGANIGTISGGNNGANLTITFTSDFATLDAVEALIQRLGYSNSDSSPNPSRTLGLRVSDGDGGTSTPNVLTINVTPDLDGTAAAYGEEQVNTYTTNHQQWPSVAGLSGGGYVVTWISSGQDGDTWGVYAQRYAGNGEAVGAEVRVNTLTAGEQNWPQIAGLSNGGYVITWQDDRNDGSGWGVYGQRYDAGGVAQGSQFLLNTFTSSNQFHDNVVAYNGGFAAVWSSINNAGGSSYDVYLQRFANDGSPVGTELRVSNVPGGAAAQTGNQYVPDVAAFANGNLVIVWSDEGGNDGSSYGVFGKIVDANNQPVGSTFLVNTTTIGNQTYSANGDYGPNVATLAGGGFVVVWPSDSNDDSGWAVVAQRFDASGNKVGSEFVVNESTTGSQYIPDVTALSTGGFVVTWYNDNYDVGGTGTTADVYIREYDAAGVAVDGQRKVSINTPSTDFEPSVADLGQGNFAVVWSGYNHESASPNTYDIFQQLYGSGAALARPSVSPQLADFTGTVTFAENTVNAGLQVIDAAVGLSDPDSGNFNGGRLDLYFIQNGAAEDRLGVVHQGTGPGQIGVSGTTVSYGGANIGTISGGNNGANLTITFTSDFATLDAVEALIQRLGYSNSDSSPNPSRTLGLRVSDGDGGTSTPNVLTINVTPDLDGTAAAYGEEQVNTYTTNYQDDPAIATLTGGGYVVAWASTGQDGASDGVYAQRYTASGVAVGPEFRVNTTVANNQNNPAVVGLSNGGFVIAWEDSSGADTSGIGVFAQRYDANGVAQGGEFQINTSVQNSQAGASLAAYNGGFVATWHSNAALAQGGDGSSWGAYAQRFDNNGGKVLTNGVNEFRVNTTTANEQSSADVAAYADGHFVVTWVSYSQDAANTYGIYAQRYGTSGLPVGSEFQVNTLTVGAQVEPHVATLADGGFVVVWTDQSGVDGGGYGVYGQRYDSSGVAQGTQFLVNEITAGNQSQPDVIGLPAGGFVVTWGDDSNNDGNGWGVFLREFDSNGVAVDGGRVVNTTTNSIQYQPAIADLGQGNYAVVWASYNQDATSTYGIFQQIFGNPAELPRQGNPVLDDVQAVHSLSYTVASPFYAGNARVIDTDVHVADPGPNGANGFNGGSLIVEFLDGTAGSHANETLAIRNQGLGAGQIGISGSNITYAGVTIGTFSGGSAGANLLVSLNLNATAAAAQALVENVTYVNSVPGAAQTDRHIGFRLFDGDGGASLSSDVLVRIQATVTPTAVDLQDVETQVTLSEAQAQTGAVLDDAVQLIYSGAGSFNNGSLTVSYVSSTGRVEDQLSIRNEGGATGQVGMAGNNVSYGGVLIGTINAADTGTNGDQLVVNFNASATDQAIERVIENLSYRTTSDGPNASRTIQLVVRDSANTASTASQVQINVTPQVDGAVKLFGEQQVNTYEPSEQHVPVVAGLQGVNDGAYVVIWRSYTQDGSSYGIYGQRYDAKGAAVGAEFQVNSHTLGAQVEPEVTSLANGGFVAVWTDQNGQDGSSYGVYAQVYGANGVPVGGEKLINTSTLGNQYEPAVVGLSDGSFVVAYRSDYTGNNAPLDVLAKRFDASGNLLTAEFTVNTTTTGTQYNPRLAALAGGKFVVVYGDASGNDGNGYGVFSKVFNADGSQSVAEQVVTTTISGQQSGHDVAALAGGGYVATWWSADNHIYGQRFDAAGAKAGGEFRISTVDTVAYNNFARVTAFDSGGFVVAWDVNGGPGGSSQDVYVQQFDASGNKIDGPTLVNSTIASTQYYADIAGLSGSNFVVTWAAYNQEANTANTYGIFSQIMGAAGSITRSAAPELVDLTTSVTFAENTVNATPQLIDNAVKLTDTDSANFNGGQLVVAIIPAGQNQVDLPFSQDQLAIRNEGDLPGQVKVSGNNVSYGGTLIGTITSNGANGSNLVVSLNASATAPAVEAVIEHLTYANNSTDPAATRLVSIQVSDGAGGASQPKVVQINVTPQVDGAVKLFGEQQVNTYEPSEQHVPVVAGLQGVNDGAYVVIWRSYTQDGSSYGIYGQRYDAKGAAVGAEFQVNSHTLGAQVEPEVTSLANGGFVAVWTDQNGQDGSSYGVYAQVYGANGVPVGGEKLINTSTLGNQYEPAVVGLSDGSFVVAYRSDYTGNNAPLDVLAKRFDASGNLLTAEFTVNTTTTGTQYNPRLAALAGGKFVVVYGDASGNDGNGYGVFSKVFNADGSQSVAEQVVTTTISGQQSGHDVAALAGGGYVATWWSADNHIYGQRFDAAGAKAGGEFRISTVDTVAYNNFARVTALDSGGFVVAWDVNGGPGGSSQDVYVQQFDASGNKIDGPTLVNSTIASTQYYADIAGLSGSNFVVTWAAYNQEANTANTYGIFSQIMGAAGSITRSAAPELVDVTTSVTFAENLVNTTPQLIDNAVKLTDTEPANFNGGQLVVSVISGYGSIEQAQLPQNPELQDLFGIRNQGAGVGQVDVVGTNVRYGGTVIGSITSNGINGHDLVVTFNASATAPAVEAVIENLTYANSASNATASRTVSIQVSDGAGGASDPRVVQVNITPDYDGAQPLYQEEVVNTYTPSQQGAPAMARLADGGYVTVWDSQTQDGWGYGIYGQRYDAQGVAVGNQFQVNNYTPYDQTEPAVSSLNSGGFVVVWTDQGGHDGSSYGLFGQRYDVNGLQVGDAFLVNSTTASNQSQASIASFAGGGFVVAWYSDGSKDGRSADIFFQRFDNNGQPQGSETRANTSTGFENQAQYEPSVTVLNDGTFMVAWRSDGAQDGSLSGVYGQHFAANGAALGSEFRINTYTDSYQYEPSIAALSGGGFVTSWTSYYQDGGGTYGVFAQRYANDGTPQGAEFRVNTTTASNENQPSVSALGSGGFVIAWTNNSQIYAQQYNASGVAVDGETRVDVKDNNYAVEPVVQGLSNGNFVVSWTDYQDDASTNTYGIFQRLFGNPADFTRQTNPLLVGVADSVTFAENDVNLMPQVIDSGVGLYDPDSANFAGGRLEVDYISGYGGQDQIGFQGLETQDQLGIRNEGNGPTQVGVSGLNVFYGGVQIGTIIANGANHGKLAVLFNANATVDAVESVIENLTYQNTASNPFTSRTVSVRVSDGDGGSSDAHFITLKVTPEVDGAVPQGLERTVNTTVAGEQVQPSVAHLTNGGYVVVWTDQGGADGNSYGVYGQRYDQDNNAVGTEFRVNTFTTGAQYEPEVVGLTGGGFVAVWRSDNQDGSGAGVYGQRYKADGSVDGSAFLVNTTTSSNQYQPTVAATDGNGFVVSWYHDSIKNGEYYDIYFQRYNGSGVPQGGEVKANTPTAGNVFAAQSEPSITWLSGGSFVVVWTDSSALDGNLYGVYGQRFDSSGTPQGSQFKVNTYTSGYQYEPSTAALKDGGFIVVWRSDGQDLSGGGVYGQRYDTNGNTVGTEFRVNTTTTSNQHEPTVTGLENGGWVVSWSDDSGLDGSGTGVFLQQYDAAGRQLDGQTRVNTYAYSTQNQPSITSMADGGFVVAYASYVSSGDGNGDGVPDGGNNTQEIHLQRFSNTAPILTDVFVSGQEDTSIVLTDELFISGFNDPEGQNLAAIKITTLPAHGIVRLDGVAIIAGQEISLANLQADKLTYQGDLNYFGADQFAWTGSDGISFASTPVYTNINLSNVNDPPGLQVGTPSDTAAEGAFFSHAITLTNPDPDTVKVTVNWGDGTPNTDYFSSQHLLNITHHFPDNGNYNVSVTANDQQNQANSIEVGGFQVAVSNVAPDLSLFGDATVEQNKVYTLTLGNIVDPGTDTVSEYRIDWGDNSPLQIVAAGDLPANRQLTHSYAATGGKTIAVSLVDEDGPYNNVESKAITVSAPAEVLTVDAGADRTVNEGTFFVQTINFTDPTDTDPVGRLYTVNWGDGNTSSGRTFNANSLDVGHTYLDGNNAYTVSVTVNDDGAQQATDSFAVTVNNVAPTLNLNGGTTTPEGNLYKLNITHSDPGADTITGYNVNWGDGSAPTILTAADLAALSGNVTHTYVDGTANLTITVQATDEDGPWTQTKAITVNDVAPTIALSGALSVNEGGTYTLTLGAVTDPGQDIATSYTINWGDGNADTVNSLGNYNHVYADGTVNRTISVLVTDEEGVHANAGSLIVTVNNVAPTVTLVGAEATNEGASYVLNIAATDPAGAADPLNYSIDWGDGGAVQLLTAAQLAALSGNVAHVFADDQNGPINTTPRTISVTADDGDGGVTTQTRVVNVDNVAPTATVSGAATVAEGSVYALTVGAVIDPGADTRTGYSIAWGDGNTDTLTPAQWAAAAGSFAHTYADGAATPTITVSATDEDGTFVLGSKTLTVNNVAPTVTLGGAAATNEGASYVLNIAATDPAGAADPLNYSIDWGDGAAVQLLTAAQLAALSGNVAHVFADDQNGPINTTPRTISVTADDGDGGITTQTRVVNVDNVAPDLTATGAATGITGVPYTLTLSNYIDPGLDTLAANGISINWGDGNVDNVNALGNVTHTFLSTGNFNIQVSLTDEDGSFANVASVATQISAPAGTVTIAAQANDAANEGDTFTRTIVFSDGADSNNDGWSYTVNWSDGVTQSGTTATQQFVLSRAFTDGNANPTATITVSDTGGVDSDTKSFSVNVANVAPIATVSGAATVAEGSVYALTVGAVTDPGADTRTGYSIAWGDGNTDTLTPAQWAAAAGSFAHTYADGAATPTITVSATDEDGTFVLGSKTLTVNNVAPTVTLGGAAATNEGASYVLNIAATDPAGAADPLNYSIDWGDGGAVQLLTAAQLAALSGNVAHVFADDQNGPINTTPRTISVTADDGDGGITTQTRVVNVDNVAPTATVSGAATVAEGSVYALTVGAVIDPGADTRTGYSIAWGDGNTDTLTPAQWAAAAGSFAHTYADGAATPTITVSATDEDGTFVLGSKTLTVNNVAPTVTLGGAAATNEGASYVLNIAATDPAGAADPLNYSIDWGDGAAVQLLTAAQLAALSGNVAHVFADDQNGPINTTPRTISVTADDGDGGITTQTRVVNVDNVAPTATVSGAATVAEGSVYALTVGAVIDPGADTRTGYSIAWGDGNTDTLTPAQWAAAAGSFAHTYADGAATPTITVSATDEDGTFVLGSKTLTVNNVAPTVTLGGAAATNEGASYVLNIAATDPAGAADPLNYSIDWGDGAAVQLLTAAQLAALSGNVAHVFADDQNGPINTTPRTISVTADDGDGGITTQTRVVNVDNVAPDLTATGAATGITGVPYTLTLSNYIDPGLDTLAANGISINWGDGNVDNVNALGNVTHTFLSTGNFNIQVSLTDEDGSFANVASVATQISAPAGTVTIAAQANDAANEGDTFTRTIVFSDGADSNNDGWSYTVNWSDGVTQSGTTATQQFVLSRAFTDGNANPTATITVSDTGGVDSDTKSFSVNVANVAPIATVSGAATVAEGSVYALTVGAVIDPGADTRTGYSIAWGDGNTDTLTPAQWAAAAGSFAHTYADGAATPTITVSATDEDGTFVLGSKTLTVNNVAPTVTLGGAAATNEGASYVLNIAATDPAGAADPLNYSIDWGDGGAVQLLTAAQLAALSGNVAHVFADDQNGPINTTPRTISVTADDGDGGITTQTRVVNVDNVAPTATVSGADSVNEATIYTLNVGTIIDPGTDTRSGYSIHWGDGSTDNFTPAQWANAGGSFNHTYADGVGDVGRTISLDLVDEDGSYLSVATKNITVKDVATPPAIIHLGDATGIVSGANPNVWAPFWTDPDVAISHKANYGSNGELWSPVTFNALAAGALSGGDLYGGDLGVSGQNLATSTIRQEIQGAEALRFDLAEPVNKVTLNLSKFFQDDDGNLLNQNEAGRLQALDGSGNVVSELTFTANSADGRQTVTLALAGDSVFKTLVLSAGAYGDLHQFIFGAYVNDGGTTIDPYADLTGKLHGSDFLVHDIEFEVPVLGAPVVP